MLFMIRCFVGESLYWAGMLYGAFVALRAAPTSGAPLHLWMVLLLVAGLTTSLYPWVASILPFIPEIRAACVWFLVTADRDSWPAVNEATALAAYDCASPGAFGKQADVVLVALVHHCCAVASWAAQNTSCLTDEQKAVVVEKLEGVDKQVGTASATSICNEAD